MEDKKQKRVIAKKDIITKAIQSYERIKMYAVPEFKKKGDKDVPYFKVKMASLDDQIYARHLSEHPNRVMIKFLELYRDHKLNDLKYEEFRKALYYDDVNPKTIQICNIFQRCVLEPEFKISEVMELAETHPDLVNRIASFALGVEEKENGN